LRSEDQSGAIQLKLFESLIVLRKIAEDDLGRKVCINEGVHLALTQLARETVTRNDSTTVIWVVAAILTLAASEEGRNGCIYAGAPLAVTELAFETSVKNNCDAAIVVAGALSTLSRSESGKKACIDAGSPEALNVLSRENAARANREASKRVADAYKSITGRDIVVPIPVSPISFGVRVESTLPPPPPPTTTTTATTTMPVFGGTPSAVSFGAGAVPVSFSSHSQPIVGATSSIPNYRDDDGMLMTHEFASLDVSAEENRWSVQSTITTVSASNATTTFAEPANPPRVNLTSATVNTPLQQGSNIISRASVGLLSISVNNTVGGGKLGAKLEEENHLFSTAKVKSVDENGLFFAKGVRAGLYFVSVDGEDVSKLSFKEVQAKIIAANKKMHEGGTISFSFTDDPDQDPNARNDNASNASVLPSSTSEATTQGRGFTFSSSPSIPSTTNAGFGVSLAQSTRSSLAEVNTSSAAAPPPFGNVSLPQTFQFGGTGALSLPIPTPIIPPLQASTSTSPSIQGSQIPSETSYRQSEMWRAINAIIDTPDTTTTSNSSSSFGLQGFGQTSERPQAPTYTYCSRCGRSSHTRSSCYASYHADGYRLYY
jgi:hypothetical protein